MPLRYKLIFNHITMYVLSHDAVSGVSPLALAIAPARHGGVSRSCAAPSAHSHIVYDEYPRQRVYTASVRGSRDAGTMQRRERYVSRGHPRASYTLQQHVTHVCRAHAAGRLESRPAKIHPRQPPREEIATPRSEHSDVCAS